jgi:hypothetical protein
MNLLVLYAMVFMYDSAILANLVIMFENTPTSG